MSEVINRLAIFPICPPYFPHIIPYVRHIFPYVRHIFLCVRHTFPYVRHISPYVRKCNSSEIPICPPYFPICPPYIGISEKMAEMWQQNNFRTYKKIWRTYECHPFYSIKRWYLAHVKTAVRYFSDSQLSPKEVTTILTLSMIEIYWVSTLIIFTKCLDMQSFYLQITPCIKTMTSINLVFLAASLWT
jgi:hypothetical protein